MKLEEKTNTVSRMGVVARKTCSMSVNAHAFNLLARQYSDPIKAILQELGCNAADSHKRAGNDEPFIVQLPTKDDPNFRIRDFGTGMDEQKIDNVYVNWMESDKRSTNDETGYFGIGSKTPLAYGDSFNITTYTNGIMRMYTMCRNEENIPELQSYGGLGTAEPNGVEISFAVKEDDFDAFEEKAKQVYQYFTLKPLINSDYDFLPKKEIRYSGNNWIYYWQSEYPMVVMGGVAYPINNSIAWSMRQKSYDLYRFIDNAGGLVIHVPIGSLDITPSREALELTPKTIETLVDVCNKVRLDLIRMIDNLLSLQNVKDMSDWAYSLLIKNIDNEFSRMGIYNSTKTLERPYPDYPRKLCKENGIRLRGHYYKKTNPTGQITVAFQNMTSSENLSPKKTKFVLAHELKGKERRLRAYLEKQGVDMIGVQVVDSFDEQQITRQQVMDFLGFSADDDMFIDVDKLPALPKASRSYTASGKPRKPKHMLEVEVLNSSGNWEETTIDPSSQDYYYVERYRDQVKLPSTSSKTFSFCYSGRDRCQIFEDELGIKIVALKSKNLSSPLLQLPTMHDFCISFVDLLTEYYKSKQQEFLAFYFPQRVGELLREGPNGTWDIYSLCENLRHADMVSSLGSEHTLSQICMARKTSKNMPLLWQEYIQHCEITLDKLKDEVYNGRKIGDWIAMIETAKKNYKGIDGSCANFNLVKAVDFYISNGNTMGA